MIILSNQVRKKTMMYEQQIDKLDPFIQQLVIDHHGNQSFFEKHKTYYDCRPLINYLSQLPELAGDKLAAIVHDRDKKMLNGKLVPSLAHLHVARSCSKPSSIGILLRAMRDTKLEHVSYKKKGRRGRRKITDEANLFSYLFHVTTGAKEDGKYQYDFEACVANFEIKSFVEKATKEAAKALKRKQAQQQRSDDKDDLEFYINEILNGRVDLADRFKDDKLQRVYAKNQSVLNNAQTDYTKSIVRLFEERRQAILTNADGKNDKLIKSYEEQIKARNGDIRKTDNYYFFGPPGSGKTFVALLVGNTYDDPDNPRGVFRAIGEKHQFDPYERQRAIDMDDVRSKTYPKEMLLTLFDYNQPGKVLDARYKQILTADLRCLIMTTTMSLDEFVRYIPDKNDRGDAEDQYFRRFREVFEFSAPTPSLSNPKDVIVTYKIYRVRHAMGFGKAYAEGRNFQALEIAKNAGFKPLAIYRKDKSNEYHIDRYSDYYLQKVDEEQVTIPVSKLDKDVAPEAERSRMKKVVKEETRKSKLKEIKPFTGLDLGNISDKDLDDFYGQLKAEVEERKKGITSGKVVPFNG